MCVFESNMTPGRHPPPQRSLKAVTCFHHYPFDLSRPCGNQMSQNLSNDATAILLLCQILTLFVYVCRAWAFYLAVGGDGASLERKTRCNCIGHVHCVLVKLSTNQFTLTEGAPVK